MPLLISDRECEDQTMILKVLLSKRIFQISPKTNWNICPCVDPHKVTCCVTANPMTGSPSKISHVTTAELTSISLMVTLSGADSVASVSRKGANHQRQLMNITPCNASERSARLSSHSSSPLPPLIPALMNQARLPSPFLLSRRKHRTASAWEFHTRRASLPSLLPPPHISLKCDS